MSKKVTRSVKIPEDIDQLMRERDDVNWSGVIRQFLQEYVASGRGTEAAMAVRLEQLDSQIADAKQELDRLKRERERVEAALEEKRQDRRGVFEEFEAIDPKQSQLDPANPAVKSHAQKAGMNPATFLEQYQEWSA